MERTIAVWGALSGLLLGGCGAIGVPSGRDGGIATVVSVQPEHRPETLRERIVRIAKGEIGDVETEGNNTGPAPRKYLAATGISVPAPYCGAGIYWCFLTAGDTLLPAAPFALAATWSRKANRIWGKDAPDTLSILPADVTCHYFSSMGRFAHVNLVEMDAGKYVKIIGFNTTDGFNRDGTGVYAKLILKSQITAISRWAPVEPEPQATLHAQAYPPR